jgi:hypothetical protein
VTKFTYLPREGDPQDTEVMRAKFPGGQAVEVDEGTEIGMQLAAKLRENAWFHEGDDAPVSKLSESKKALAAEKRDQARQLWTEAYDLDPEGTEADRTPPEHVHNQQNEVSLDQLSSRPGKTAENDAGASEGGAAFGAEGTGEGKAVVQGDVPPGA